MKPLIILSLIFSFDLYDPPLSIYYSPFDFFNELTLEEICIFEYDLKQETYQGDGNEKGDTKKELRSTSATNPLAETWAPW